MFKMSTTDTLVLLKFKMKKSKTSHRNKKKRTSTNKLKGLLIIRSQVHSSVIFTQSSSSSRLSFQRGNSTENPLSGYNLSGATSGV